MKNPFTQMAVMAAVMMAAIGENNARSMKGWSPYVSHSGHSGSKKKHHHLHNPAGSKLLRRMYRHATGLRGTAQEASAWYGGLKEKYPSMPYKLGDCRNPLLWDRR